MSDAINPAHYKKHPSGVECIELSKHLSFCLGSALNYVWRAGSKSANSAEQDLKKAFWYVEKERSINFYNALVVPLPDDDLVKVLKHESGKKADAIKAIFNANNSNENMIGHQRESSLIDAKEAISAMIQELKQ